MTQTRKPPFKRKRTPRHNVAVYVGAVAFLIGYLFGAGFIAFTVG